MPTGVTKQQNDYIWRGTVANGKTLTLTFPLPAGKTGLYPLAANATMTVNGATSQILVQDTFTVHGASPPSPTSASKPA